MANPEISYFVDKFHTTIEDARNKSLFSQELDSLLAYPLTLEPEDPIDDFLGALWVPPVKIQNQLGPVEHWRGITAFISIEAEYNRLFSDSYRLRLGNYRGYLWLVQVEPPLIELSCHDELFPLSGIKEQVATDFAISISVG